MKKMTLDGGLLMQDMSSNFTSPPRIIPPSNKPSAKEYPTKISHQGANSRIYGEFLVKWFLIKTTCIATQDFEVSSKTSAITADN